MTPDVLSWAALVCFALGSLAAVAGFKLEAFRNNRLQALLAGAGLLLKTAAIGVSCHLNTTHFFNSSSEIFGLFAWALSFSYLVALAVSAVRSLGALVLPLVTILLALSQVFDKHTGDPGVPANWLLAAHILAAFLGYGLFLTACGAGVLYLEQSRMLKRKVFGILFRDLPSLEKLERLELVCGWLGLVIFVIALASGGIMAHRLHKPFWTDPKILAADVTFGVFGLLVVGRTLRLLHGRKAAQFLLVGAALIVLTFIVSHPLAKPEPPNSPQPQTTSNLESRNPRGAPVLHRSRMLLTCRGTCA